MNEQIKELALECGAWHQVYGNRNFMIDEHFDIEKFAELIVKECIQVASPNYMSTPEDSAYYVELAIDRIADYFGVES